jgi:hypothetical protein
MSTCEQIERTQLERWRNPSDLTNPWYHVDMIMLFRTYRYLKNDSKPIDIKFYDVYLIAMFLIYQCDS